MDFIEANYDRMFALVSFMVSAYLAVFAILDNRRLRTDREKAVITARGVIERTYGTLIGIKTSVNELQNVISAIDDGLEAINQSRSKLDEL